MSSARRIFVAAVIGLLALMAQYEAARAIPSPELIVSSAAGLSQLWGLAALALGGSSVALALSGHGQAVARWRRLALLAGVMALSSVCAFAWLWVSTQNARTAQLEATLTRPSPIGADGKPLDATLLEFSYKTQLASNQGVSTTDAALELNALERGERPELIALDVRETAESEMGGVAGARAIRFPDLATSGIDFTGKRVLLFCHNGNRSGETCLTLNARGIPCQFMVGGYEKWLVEGRSLAGKGARTLADFRALTPFQNQTTLLETRDVKELMLERGAILVDVRYPGEFAASHVPGALSLPLRAIPTPELEQRFAQLPAGPIIAPCYDRRSCFFAEVLGRELTRRGREFLGRYTLPWEYFVVPPRPPHLVAWMERANQSAWRKSVDELARQIQPLMATLGLAGVIVLLAVVSRAVVAPFAWKGDRDQRILQSLRAQTIRMKADLKHDPVRLARALRDQMRAHHLTPGRNALALLFIPALALGIEVVIALAAQQPTALWWMSDLAQPDPRFVLPIAFSVLITLYLVLALVKRGWQRLVVWLVGSLALSALTMSLPAAATLYMCVSSVLLLLQRWVSTWRWAWVVSQVRGVRTGWTTLRLHDRNVVSLSNPTALKRAGNKAYRLGVLTNCNIAVPAGIVLTDRFLARWALADDVWRTAKCKRFAKVLGSRPLAVRSSAGNEDSAARSFAGVFSTQINVQPRALAAAIDHVLASFSDPRAQAYALDAGCANIVLQPMVKSRYAGVMFTRDPAVPGCCLIEWVEGQGEALVSGHVRPDLARFGRLTGERVGASEHKLPFDLAALATLGRQIEAEFGCPQDIEWAHDGHKFWILQSRDIVSSAQIADPVIHEWQRLAQIAEAQANAKQLAPSEPMFTMDDMAELLPAPTPISLALLEAVSASGGSLDLAARSLGGRIAFSGHNGTSAPASLYVMAFGALRTNQPVRATRALQFSALAAQRLRRNSDALEADLRQHMLPAIEARAALLAATDLSMLATHDLQLLFAQSLRHWLLQTRVAVDRVNIAAQFYANDARRQLKRAGYDPAPVLARTPPTTLQERLSALANLTERDRPKALQAALGHRSALDYELAAPRYGEDWSELITAAQVLLQSVPPVRSAQTAEKLPPRLAPTVIRARRFQTLKEDAKHHGLRDMAVLRRILLALDSRFELGGLIFWLTLDEIATLSWSSGIQLGERAQSRQVLAATLAACSQPTTNLGARDIEAGPLGATLGQTESAQALSVGSLAGQRVAGSGTAEGRAIRVSVHNCSNGQPIPGFHDGDIIVARTFHPAWLPELMRCGGIIVEVGGWLSHTAIMARERGIAMCVGVSQIDQIETGMWLRLSPNGSISRQPPPNLSP